MFTNTAEGCPSLVCSVLLILILLGRGRGGCRGGVGWTAHLIRALTSPLSKSDEIIPNWCQYGLGFGPLQAHWQVRLREGTLMKTRFFALLKLIFSADFLPKKPNDCVWSLNQAVTLFLQNSTDALITEGQKRRRDQKDQSCCCCFAKCSGSVWLYVWINTFWIIVIKSCFVTKLGEKSLRRRAWRAGRK